MPKLTQHAIDPTIDHLVGLKIAELRKRQNMTQQMLADRSGFGIGRTSIANIETGRQSINVSNLVLMADALGIHPGTLFPVKGEIEEVRVSDLFHARQDRIAHRLVEIRRLVRRWDIEDGKEEE